MHKTVRRRNRPLAKKKCASDQSSNIICLISFRHTNIGNKCLYPCFLLFQSIYCCPPDHYYRSRLSLLFHQIQTIATHIYILYYGLHSSREQDIAPIKIRLSAMGQLIMDWCVCNIQYCNMKHYLRCTRTRADVVYEMDGFTYYATIKEYKSSDY